MLVFGSLYSFWFDLLLLVVLVWSLLFWCLFGVIVLSIAASFVGLILRRLVWF